MPQLPRYYANTNLPNVSLPRKTGADIKGQGLVKAGEQLFAIGKERVNEQIEEARKLKQIADTNEVLRIGLETEKQLNDLPFELEREGVSYKDYYGTWKQRVERIYTDTRGQYENASPETKLKVDNYLGRLLLEHHSKAQEKAFKMAGDYERGALTENLNRLKNAISESPPEKAVVYTEIANGLIERAKGGGIIGQEEAVKRAHGFNQDVTENRVKLDILSNPENALDKLQTGQYPDLDTDKLVRLIPLAESAWKSKVAAIERFEKRVEKYTQEKYDQNARSFMLKADLGQLQAGEITTALANDDIDVKWHDHLMKTVHTYTERDKQASKIESDPQVYRMLALDAYSLNPQYKPEDVDDFAARLSNEDIRGLKSRYVTAWEHKDNIQKQQYNDRHSQAEQIGLKALTTRSPLEPLDSVSQQVQVMFLEALTKRSARYGGEEDPIEVLNDILPVYRKMLQERQIDEVTALRTQLRFNPHELEEAFKAGEIDKSTYDAQRQLIIGIMQKELEIGANPIKK